MANYSKNRDNYLYTCAFCNKKFTLADEPGYGHFGKRYLCQDCSKEKEQEKKGIVDKQKKAILDKAKEYLGDLYDEEKVKRDIADLLKMPNVKKTGIAATLDYWYKIKGNDPSKSFGGIGIVKYVYKDAEAYYRQKLEADKRKRASVQAAGEHDNFLFERKKPTVILKPATPYYGKNDRFELD